MTRIHPSLLITLLISALADRFDMMSAIKANDFRITRHTERSGHSNKIPAQLKVPRQTSCEPSIEDTGQWKQNFKTYRKNDFKRCLWKSMVYVTRCKLVAKEKFVPSYFKRTYILKCHESIEFSFFAHINNIDSTEYLYSGWIYCAKINVFIKTLCFLSFSFTSMYSEFLSAVYSFYEKYIT